LSQKVNNDATITTTNAQIEAAKANIDAIKTQISKTTIRALFNGKVDKDDAIVGSIVSAGTPVITISNDNLEIQVNIPESEVSNVKIGSAANITLDAFGTNEIFPATVVSVDSVQTLENGISVYKARLKFTDTDEKIKAGMTANITITPETHPDVLIIPSSAVIQKNGKYFVIIDKGNSEKEAREVTIGLKDNQNVEILSGLILGEKVYSY
jgi:RND family efflux transporter MFP subunit